MSGSHPAELLLDTHALLWWLAEPDRLSPAAYGAIADPGNRVHVSAASGWEIATKVHLGKLPVANELLEDLPELLAAQGFQLLPITLLHGLRAGGSHPGRTERSHPGEPCSCVAGFSLLLALVAPSALPRSHHVEALQAQERFLAGFLLVVRDHVAVVAPIPQRIEVAHLEAAMHLDQFHLVLAGVVEVVAATEET